MTFDDLYQELGKMSPAERKAYDLTIFEPNDQEFFQVSMRVERLDDKDEELGGILDELHPYLRIKYV